MKLKKMRTAFQTVFFLLIIYGIYKYYLFIYYGKSRPDFLDGFLPIVGAYDIILKIRTGITDPFHPAAMAIMISSIVTTLILGKCFCSWICPVGTLLDYISFIRNKFSFFKKLDALGSKIKDKNYFPVIDAILRSPKYLLLGWLLYSIVCMPAQMMIVVAQNMNSSADIGLFKFWVDMFHGRENLFALIIGILIILSFFIPRFWCKYLCPLGAFYGIFNLFSITRLRRDPKECSQCRNCSDCLIGLTPYKMSEFNNTECTMCLQCKSNCPNSAIKLQILGRNIPLWIYPVMILCVFFGTVGLFMKAGVWHSQLSMKDEAYFVLKHGFNVKWAKDALMN